MVQIKINELEEIYQDVEIDGKVVATGLRDCKKRWSLFEKYIKPHDVILDIGSSLGFYAHKIAKLYPDALILSFESDPKMCEIQSQIFEEEGIYNVVVCQHRLIIEDLQKLTFHTEVFDVILALAVLHHYPEGLVEKAFDYMKTLAHTVITEVPDSKEIEACGGRARKESIKATDGGVWLGSSKSHLGEYDRDIMFHVGNRERVNLDAYFGVDHVDRHKFKIDKYGRINGKYIIPGVNYHNLKQFNPVWPKKKWFEVQARKAYECLEFKSDVRPWNLIMTSRGLVARDFMTKFPIGDQAEFKEEDLDKL